MAPVKWGIVSTANINRKLIPGAHASDKVELAAVASRDHARADAYAREWKIPRAYGSYEDLLADPEIEAVYISLPNTLHCEWSMKAMKAGKHVLCEKPLSRSPQEVAETFAVAERTGMLMSEAFMWRHNPQTKKLQELVDGGAIGELRLIRSAFSYSLYDETNIRLRTDVDGGALMDIGC
jgi:D-xylose 1-dehydrogenase (NADP+, D-xylono-1,5-lactone-forming)